MREYELVASIWALKTDTEILKDIGNRLRARRLDQLLTQKELGKRAGVGVNTIKRIESGRPVLHDAFVSVIRNLSLLDNLEQAITLPAPSPLNLVRERGKTRVRARARRR